MRLKEKLSIVVLILLFSFFPARANAATLSDISKQLICQCGCTLVLANCTHVECHSREAMTTFIAQQLDQGQSEKQILQLFVTQYGEQVLASPPKRGFNLMAWLLPFVAILAGGVVIYAAIKKWVGRGRLSEAYAVTETGEEDEKYQRQLEEELKEFNEGSFR